MNKTILLAVAIALTSVGIGFSMNIASQVKEDSRCNSFKCTSCNGTTWGKDNLKCWVCKGTGAQGSY